MPGRFPCWRPHEQSRRVYSQVLNPQSSHAHVFCLYQQTTLASLHFQRLKTHSVVWRRLENCVHTPCETTITLQRTHTHFTDSAQCKGIHNTQNKALQRYPFVSSLLIGLHLHLPSPDWPVPAVASPALHRVGETECTFKTVCTPTTGQ